MHDLPQGVAQAEEAKWMADGITNGRVEVVTSHERFAHIKDGAGCWDRVPLTAPVAIVDGMKADDYDATKESLTALDGWIHELLELLEKQPEQV